MRGRARPRSWTRPWCSRLLVEISRALIAIAAYGGVRRADERRDAVPRQCRPEIVVHRTVAGNKRVGLAPVAARFHEQIGLTLIGVASDRGAVRADEGGAAVQGSRTAARGELLHLTPRAIRLGKDVGRALKGMAVDSRIVRADEGGAAVQRNRLAETGVRRTVTRGELLHLTTRAIRLGEHIERALACVAADSGLRRTDEYGGALERDGEAKVIVGRTIIGS